MITCWFGWWVSSVARQRNPLAPGRLRQRRTFGAVAATLCNSMTSVRPCNDPDPPPEEDKRVDFRRYAVAHARGLIREHRYLQHHAAADALPVLLGELIRWNPTP